MDLNTLRIPIRTLHTSTITLSEDRKFISLRDYLVDTAFSSLLPPQIASEPMAADDQEERFSKASSPPSCGQPPYDENEDPLELNIQSIEDYIRDNPPAKRPQSKPTVAQRESKPGPESVSRFYQLCQSCNITPKITETEVRPQWFTATVEFASEKITSDEAFPNKKAAREAICELAIERFREQFSSNKRKASNQTVPFSEADQTENCIGILQEYAQREKLALPKYTESKTSTVPSSFVCTVSIPSTLKCSSNVSGKHHGTKKAAKAEAAKIAVQTLRDQGKISTPGNAKRTKSTTSSAEYHGGGTGLAQIMRSFSASETKSPSPPSLPQQIHDLATSLGFQSPMWDVQCSEPESGNAAAARLPLWDVAAHFTERDVKAHPRLAGPVGQVWRVHGKERAKLECCGKVLKVLMEVEKEMDGRLM